MSLSKSVLTLRNSLLSSNRQTHPLFQYKFAKMSSSYKPPFTYISATDLANQWKSQGSKASEDGHTIIDVRDDDFEGGHIKGCKNIPSNQFTQRVENLVKELENSKSVIFHCSLSQQRGPKAARIYKESREDAMESGKISSTSQKGKDDQKVQVLRDGFSNFGSIYKNDSDLVEDYDEESWKYR